MTIDNREGPNEGVSQQGERPRHQSILCHGERNLPWLFNFIALHLSPLAKVKKDWLQNFQFCYQIILNPTYSKSFDIEPAFAG